MLINEIASLKLPRANDEIHEETASVSSRRSRSPSNVSFECHSALVFEEINAILDEAESISKERGTASNHKMMKKQNLHGVSILDKELKKVGSRPCSEISLNSILEDETISVVRKLEARIIDREVRSGSKLFRSRSDAAFVPTSVAGRVIRSASGATLRSAGLTHPGTLSTHQNATFSSPSMNLDRGGMNRITKASNAGRALLSASYASKRGHHMYSSQGGNSGKAMGSGTGTSCSDSFKMQKEPMKSSHRHAGDLFKEALDSANFMKMMDGQ